MHESACKFEITYFKENGKFYTSESVNWFVEKNQSGNPYMPEVIKELKRLRDENKLPGLVGCWEGYIMVDCENGYPCLILPKE